MGTGNVDQGTAGSTVDLQDVDTDQIAGLVLLAGDLLGNTQDSVLLLVALADLDEDIAGGIQTQDGAGQQLLSLGRVALVSDAALSLTDALDDDLLGSLGSDAAELLDVDGQGDGIAQLDVGVGDAGSVDVDLQRGVPQVVDNGLDLAHEDALLGDVDDDILGGDVTVILTILAVCIGQRLLQTLHHVIHGNALGLLQLLQSGEDLGAIDLVGLGLLLGFGGSSHFFFPPLKWYSVFSIIILSKYALGRDIQKGRGLLSEFNSQAHQCDLGLFKGNGLLAGLDGDLAVFVTGQDAGDLLQAVAGTVELDGDGAAHEPLEIGGTLQRALQTGGADLKVVALGDGVGLIEKGIDGTGDGLAVGDVHTALLVQVQAQEPLVALTDVLHIPELAAMGFHNGLCDLGNDISYFHQNTPFSIQEINKKERGAPLSSKVFYRTMPL